MKKLPEEDRAKIEMQVEVFRVEKRKFDIELSKWDDTGNEIIVLAKHMCTIMMEMTDFTRGKFKYHLKNLNPSSHYLRLLLKVVALFKQTWL
jgi:hypothetical protein